MTVYICFFNASRIVSSLMRPPTASLYSVYFSGYTHSMPDVQKIIEELPSPPKKDVDLIMKAYDFAQHAHEGQKRFSGEPYFLHVFSTAKILADLGMSPTVIAAGFLHDTIEDSGVDPKTIEKEFGKEILFLVQGVTKLGKVKYTGVERNVESLRKFFVSMAEDLRVIIIKLADRMHNVETLKYVRPDKQRRIAMETLEIYAPLANRFSMGKLRGRLEDAAFPFAYPKEYERVVALLKEKTSANEKYLREVEKTVTEKMKENNIKYLAIDMRVKHLYSLYTKLLRYDMDIGNIHDMIALRIIVNTVEECYQVLGLIHSIWKPLPGKIKDYIALPKQNGYRSLHTTIFTGTGGIVEIQIRTEQMHREAEYGLAAHFSYKEQQQGRRKKAKHEPDTDIEKQYAWVEELKHWQAQNHETGTFLESLKMDFFKNRVFAFTPHGDVIDLPEGASPIDFAYGVHSDIGNHAFGAKVNSKFVALDTKLKNGDIVHIMTKKESHPTDKWLEFVKTTFAKKHIRSYLQEHGFQKRSIPKKLKH